MTSETTAPRRWEKLQPFEHLIVDDNGGNNPPIITAVLRIQGEVTSAWATRNLAERFATHPRFRSCVDLKKKRFVEHVSFDPASHVERRDEALTPNAFDQVLSTPLGKSQPPWIIFVFAPRDTDVSDVVFRVHHVVGDGVGLVQFALSKIVSGIVPSKEEKEPLPPRRTLHPTLVEAGGVGTTMDKLTRPFRDVYGVTINLFFPDPRHAFNTGILTPKKRGAWARPRSVHALRTISRQLGITLNDLLLGALTGALRAYAMEFDTKVPKKMHTALPVNQHRPDASNFVLNALTVLVMKMPLHHDERNKRLAECTRIMRDMKTGIRIPLSWVMFSLLSSLPRSIQIRLWKRITKRVTLLFTNVPGPTEIVKCGDRDIVDIRVLAPAQASTGVVVSAFSYADNLNVGLWTDANHVREPQKFLKLYDEEINAIFEWVQLLEDAREKAVAGGSPRLSTR